MQRKLEEAQAFMETVNNSKMGRDWREKTAASEPGQLGRFVGEGMMIGNDTSGDYTLSLLCMCHVDFRPGLCRHLPSHVQSVVQ